MKKSLFVLQIITLLAITFFSNTGRTSAASKPQEILKKKYPNEIIMQIKSADINNDKKPEHFILTDSGNFYFVNSNGIIALVNTGISSENGDAKIQVFSVNKKEKHVAVSFEYFPSNTQMYVYRLKNNGLVKMLDIMGDQGIQIDGKGKIHMYWKKYRDEGGWDPVEAIYTWNSTSLKYKGTGYVP
jgi:hypothetical protein